MFVLRAGPGELLRCRFATSPLFELGSAVRTTHRPAGQRWHLPWLATVATVPAPEGLDLLRAMQPPRGYTPDFLAPPPLTEAPDLAAELARVACTPPDRVAAELARCRDDAAEPAVAARLDALARDPARALAEVVRALQTCWDALLAPHWPAVRRLLDRDLAHRGRQLLDGGLLALLDDLHPDVRLRDGAVQVDWRRARPYEERVLGGDGVVLVPSAFTWPRPVAVLDPPWQPSVVYPARGLAELWGGAAEPSAGLAGVLGRTRARLLLDLAEPAATAELARRLELAPATVSRHLHALLAAGLLTARRDRRRVLYERTRLGSDLCRG